MKKIKTILLFIAFFSSFKSYSQWCISGPDAFFLFIKTNKLTSASSCNVNPYEKQTWLDFYGKLYDPINYKIKTKNEFDRKPYLDEIKSEFDDGIGRVKKTQCAEIYGFFGEYDSEKKGFPLYFDLGERTKANSGKSEKELFSEQNVFLLINQITNKNEFSCFWPVDIEEAKKIVKDRTKQTGSIDRTVKVVMEFTVMEELTTNEKTITQLFSYLKVCANRVIFYKDKADTKPILTFYPINKCENTMAKDISPVSAQSTAKNSTNGTKSNHTTVLETWQGSAYSMDGKNEFKYSLSLEENNSGYIFISTQDGTAWAKYSISYSKNNKEVLIEGKKMLLESENNSFCIATLKLHEEKDEYGNRYLVGGWQENSKVEKGCPAGTQGKIKIKKD